MRYAVIGDVHANLPALEAVLADLAGDRIDAYICPGDLVGYGPMPDACVAAVMSLDPVAVAGNHDRIALDRLTTARCSPTARTTLEWTAEVLGPAARAALAALPATAGTEAIVVAHGSIEDPQEYVDGPAQAQTQLEGLRAADPAARILILGHTHVQMAVGERRGEVLRASTGTVRIDPTERIVLNSGSVGQSRDRWPRARYLVLDTESGEAVFRSLHYDTGLVRRALRAAGLPEDAYHARPYVSSRLGRAVVRRVPPRVRRGLRQARSWVVR
jgi:predicted phosphodiesterase